MDIYITLVLRQPKTNTTCKGWEMKWKTKTKQQTLRPLSMILMAYSLPLCLSLTSFATPKFPDPISLIVSYLSSILMTYTQLISQQTSVIFWRIYELQLAILKIILFFVFMTSNFQWGNKLKMFGFAAVYINVVVNLSQVEFKYAFKKRV